MGTAGASGPHESWLRCLEKDDGKRRETEEGKRRRRRRCEARPSMRKSGLEEGKMERRGATTKMMS